jgi:hypothetical protein
MINKGVCMLNCDNSIKPEQKKKLGVAVIVGVFAPLVSGLGGAYAGFFANSAAATKYAAEHGCEAAWSLLDKFSPEKIADTCGTACEAVCEAAMAIENSSSLSYALWFGLGAAGISALTLGIYGYKIYSDNKREAEQGHLQISSVPIYGSI